MSARKKVVPTTWGAYLELIAPAADVTQVQFADRVLETGIEERFNQTTVSNWRRGVYSPPRATTVNAVALAFGREPLEALVAAGHVDINWVTKSLSSRALNTLKKIGFEPTSKK